MITTIQFQVTPEQAKDDAFLKLKIRKELKLKSNDFTFQWRKRSLDARQRKIKMNCTFNVGT